MPCGHTPVAQSISISFNRLGRSSRSRRATSHGNRIRNVRRRRTHRTQRRSVVCSRLDRNSVERSDRRPVSARHRARRFPDRPAVVFREQGIRWTWQRVRRRSRRAGGRAAGARYRKGDRVGIWSPNRVEWLLTQFATARIGAVLVNINPAYRLAELEYALNKVGCKAIIAAERFKTSMYLEMLQELAPELATQAPGELHAARLPDLRYVIRMCDARNAGHAELLRRDRAGRARRSTSREARRHRRDAVMPATRSTSSSPAARPAIRRARR